MGFICDDCAFKTVDTDRKGQRNIFNSSSHQQEIDEMMDFIDKTFGTTPDDPKVPSAILHAWISKRCMTRKTRDDWTGLRALHRDFTEYQGHEFTAAAFKTAIERAGYAVANGMASRIILKEDHESLQVRTLRPRAQADATGAVAERHRATA
jgi:hypothetical protein